MKQGHEIKDQDGEKFWIVADNWELTGNSVKLYLEEKLIASFWGIKGFQVYDLADTSVAANDGAEE